jgi:hypothetical protein
VDPVLKRFLQGYAVTHDTTTAKLVREVLSEWVFEKVDHTSSKRVDHTLHRLDLLSKQLQLKVAVLPAKGHTAGSERVVRSAGTVRIPGRGTVRQEEEEDTGPRRVDTVKERESVYWMVVAMLKEAQTLSENEALAEKAGSRMDAMKVAGALARVGEAILAGYDRAYIQPRLDEVEQLIEQLKEQIKQTDQKGQEKPQRSAAT